MRNPVSSAQIFLADVTEKVKSDLLGSLAPITRRIAAAAAELEAALGGAAVPKGRRGRGARKGVRRGRALAPKAQTAPGARVAGVQRNPRGTLQKQIRSVLQGSGALTLAAIRDQLVKSPLFVGRNPKTLYTQIVQAVKRLSDIQKTDKGAYALKAGAGRSRRAAGK